MAGRVIDLARAASASPERDERGSLVFRGDRVDLYRLEVGPGRRARVETAPGEEQVWVAIAGRGAYRPDALGGADGPSEPLSPGQAAVVRENGWYEVRCEGQTPLVLIGVCAPVPVGQASADPSAPT